MEVAEDSKRDEEKKRKAKEYTGQKEEDFLPGSLFAESILSMAGWVSQNIISAVDADSTISPFYDIISL